MLGRRSLAPHPFCAHCGLVKAVGGASALTAGGLVNLLARVEHRLARDGYRITEAQRRLIVQWLARENLDDVFGLTRGIQLALFADVIARFTGLEPAYLMDSFRTT